MVGSSIINIVSIVSLIVGLFVVFVLTDEHGGGVWSLEVHVCFCSCDHGIPPPMMVMQAQNKFNFVVVTMVSRHRPAAACMMMLSMPTVTAGSNVMATG